MEQKQANQANASFKQVHDAKDRPSHQTRATHVNTGTSKRMAPVWRARRLGVSAGIFVLTLFYVIGLAWFARPSTSTVEMRELTTFPDFSVDRLVSGEFFSDVALWYSDTYPLREGLVSASRALDHLHGIEVGERMVGGNVVADELPPTDNTTATTDTEVPTEQGSANPEEGVEDSTPAWQNEGPVEVPTAEAMQAEMQANIMSGLYVRDGAAYSVYYFVQDAVERYAHAMNVLADELDGQAKVYSVLAPNNSGAMLDEETLAALGGTDQREALKYFYSLMNDKVGKVFTLDALREHNDEYIFFRTDHHWTQLGAYYAYCELEKARGVDPQPVLSWETMSFEPFLGTLYSEVQDPAMKANPDRVDAYIPAGTNDMVYWDTEGNRMEWYVCADVSDWAINSYYMTFIAGDRPLTIIDNSEAHPDKPVGLVIKDSYGCAFTPCLVDDYSTLYVIDYRYSDENLPSFVRANNVDEVIFINNMTMAGTDAVSQKILSMVSSS